MSKVSVIVPAYNAEDRLSKTVHSISGQLDENGFGFSRNELEIMLVDDCSTDSTFEKMKDIRDATGNVYILQTSKNSGTPGHVANNLGILHSTGDYVVRLDSDDIFLPGYIQKVKSVLDKNKDIDFVNADYEEFDERTGETEIVDAGVNPFNSIAIGVMFRKDLLSRIGIYDPSFFFAEYDLMHRALTSGANRGHIAEPLFRYIRNDSSQTQAKERVELGRKQLFDKWGEFPMRNY